MRAFLVVEAGNFPSLQQLCFKHLAAYCIIGTMSGASTEQSAHLRNQITAFLNFCRLEKGLCANSLDAYSTDLARFKEFIGDSTDLPATAEIRLHIVNLYQSGLSGRSVGRHLTTIRNFYGNQDSTMPSSTVTSGISSCPAIRSMGLSSTVRTRVNCFGPNRRSVRSRIGPGQRPHFSHNGS